MGAFDFTNSDTYNEVEDQPPQGRIAGRSRLSDKSKIVYVILALVFGGLGIHNFYAGRFIRGFMQFGLLAVSIPLCIVLIGFLTVWIPSVWAIFDICTVTTDGSGRKFS